MRRPDTLEKERDEVGREGGSNLLQGGNSKDSTNIHTYTSMHALLHKRRSDSVDLFSLRSLSTGMPYP